MVGWYIAAASNFYQFLFSLLEDERDSWVSASRCCYSYMERPLPDTQAGPPDKSLSDFQMTEHDPWHQLCLSSFSQSAMHRPHPPAHPTPPNSHPDPTPTPPARLRDVSRTFLWGHQSHSTSIRTPSPLLLFALDSLFLDVEPSDLYQPWPY